MKRQLVQMLFFFLCSTSALASAQAARNLCYRPVSQPDYTITAEQAEKIVHLFYKAFLFRGPDDEGKKFHVNYILQYGYYGLLFSAARFADSGEFRDKIARHYSSEQIVQNIYRTFFSRELDANTPWPGYIERSRADCAAWGIASSQEFFIKQLLSTQ